MTCNCHDSYYFLSLIMINDGEKKTKNFSFTKIFEGGFGLVHKGGLQDVAMKILKKMISMVIVNSWQKL